MDQVHLLRCLVEVGSRLGRCAEAMAYAARAARTAEEFDLEPHTGWFIAGVAELAGGDLARARTLAERGVRAAEEAGDTRYLQRHLLVLGQALLRSGEAEAARTALRADPRRSRPPRGSATRPSTGGTPSWSPAWSPSATWPRPTSCSTPPAAPLTAGSAPTASVPSSTARRPRCSARAATSRAR